MEEPTVSDPGRYRYRGPHRQTDQNARRRHHHHHPGAKRCKIEEVTTDDPISGRRSKYSPTRSSKRSGFRRHGRQYQGPGRADHQPSPNLPSEAAIILRNIEIPISDPLREQQPQQRYQGETTAAGDQQHQGESRVADEPHANPNCNTRN